MELNTNKVFKYLRESDKKISVHQGGARSGKTYNILIWFIVKLLKEENKVLTICRKTMPSIKGTVMRDFINILESLGIYQESFHNKSDSQYILGGNLVEFVSLDQPQKIRGRKRQYLFINEANELNFEDWQQLVIRTEDKIVLDYNPSDEFHWIYDKVLTREDCDFHITTYQDNPFLPEEVRKEIEYLKEIDENYWRVFGLGQRGASQETIYTKWELTEKDVEGKETLYGLDFGFNHPTALIRVESIENEAYIYQELYESYLTNEQLIQRMNSLGIPKDKIIYADCARPEAIKELNRAGYKVKPTVKGQNSVKMGIDYVKRQKLLIHKESQDLLKEIKSYKWKTDKDGHVLDEPVKFNDDAIDALRYCFNGKIQFKRKSSLVMATTDVY